MGTRQAVTGDMGGTSYAVTLCTETLSILFVLFCVCCVCVCVLAFLVERWRIEDTDNSE